MNADSSGTNASSAGGAGGTTGVSARKAAANAANARRATGPRTELGKEWSARNAIKHGAYASTPTPIHRGTFAEDPQTLTEYVEAIVQSLTPRDPIEHAQAQRIAWCYVRGVRLRRYEAEILSAPRPEELHEKHPDTLDAKPEHWRRVQHWLTTGEDTGVDFDMLASDLIVYAAATRPFSFLRRQTSGLVDGSDRETCEAYLDGLFEDRVLASEWAATQWWRADRLLQDREGAAARSAEHFVAELDRIEIMRQRIARELERAQHQYGELKRRTLSPGAEVVPPRNEPTDQAKPE